MKGSQTLSEGIPYRINQLVDILGKSRPTIERYIERFSIETTSVEYNGKDVQAVILTAENIDQLIRASKGVDNVDREPVITSDETLSQGDRKPFATDRDHHPWVLQERLKAAQAEIEGLKSLLDERQRLVESKDSEIESKQSEINTLKASMMMLENKNQERNQDKTIELVPSNQSTGFLQKMKAWFTGA